MRMLKKIFVYLALILCVTAINGLVRYTMDDGTKFQRRISVTVYIIIFTILLLYTAIFRRHKTATAMVLLAIFPCIVSWDILGAGEYQVIGQNIMVCGVLFSLIDLFIDSRALGTGNLTLIEGIRTHHLIIVLQLYSIVFAVLVSFYTAKIEHDLRKMAAFYNKLKIYFAPCLVLCLGYFWLFKATPSMRSYVDAGDWAGTVAYIFCYMLVLILFKKLRNGWAVSILSVLLVLFFPVIMASGDTVNMTHTDDIERLAQYVKVAPLAEAIATAIIPAPSDVSGHWYALYHIKLYTAFQVLLVLLLLPAALTSKSNKNG